MNINKCKIFKIPNIIEKKGKLNFLEMEKHVPFNIKRIFYISDVPLFTSRGDHAHRINHQLIICVKGSVEVTVNDGKRNKIYNLKKSNQALYIPPMIWSKQIYNDHETICLVLASENYDKKDYISKYEAFLNMSRN